MCQRSSTHSRRAATIPRNRAQLPSARQAALLTLSSAQVDTKDCSDLVQAASFVFVYRLVPQLLARLKRWVHPSLNEW